MFAISYEGTFVKIMPIIWYINMQVTSSCKPVVMWNLKCIYIYIYIYIYKHVGRIDVCACKYVYIDG